MYKVETIGDACKSQSKSSGNIILYMSALLIDYMYIIIFKAVIDFKSLLAITRFLPLPGYLVSDMVVSGVPIRNGKEHAPNIANMALDILHESRNFVIPAMPDEPLKIRIGLHTGKYDSAVAHLAHAAFRY